MKRLILAFLILISIFSFFSFAQSDLSDSLSGWDLYYYLYGIRGYPTYNKTQARYDFFDIEGSYCGSLAYNPLLEEWEYFGL